MFSLANGNPKERDHIEGTTSSELVAERSRSHRLRLFMALGLMLIIVFSSVLELFIVKPGLPPVGEISPYALRAQHDFVALKEPDLSTWPKLTDEPQIFEVNQKNLDTRLSDYEDILNDLATIKTKKNSDLTVDLETINVKLQQRFPLETLKRVMASQTLKNLKPDLLAIVKPYLLRGILPTEADLANHSVIVVDPEDNTFTILAPTEAMMMTEEAVRQQIIANVQENFGADRTVLPFLEVLATGFLGPTLTNSEHYQYLLRPRTAELFAAAEFYKRGAVFLKTGTKVTDIDALRYKASIKGSQYPFVVITIATLACFVALIVAFFLYCEQFYQDVFADSKNYLVLALALFILLMVAKPVLLFSSVSPVLIPIGIIPLLTVSIVDKRLGLSALLVSSLMITLVTEFSLYLFLYFLLSGAAAYLLAITYKNMRDLILSSIMLGVWNSVVVTLLFIFSNQPFELSAFIPTIAEAFFGGIAWLIGLILIPLFEKVFDLSSDFRLIEFGDLNHPLLKQLMENAPGSYHHSIMTGNLAGIAADAMGANHLLARIGGYYHDIGKLSKPEFFMENSQTTANPHSNLSPMRSINIIKEHVTKGVEMGQKYRLPKAMIDIIAEHHGTTMMESFYYKTMKDDLNKDIPQEFFRYSGNRPNSLEAALVMIADSVEAISRVVSDLTEEKAENIIKEVIKNKFQDGQFENVPLTTRHISIISSTMSRALMGKMHRRQGYPELPKSR